jgi:c-di-GMP-binding flagellar brake protein YcgR
MTGDDKKRGAERLELLGELRGEVMVFQPTTIRQISTGGMQIETAFPLQLNSLHDFRLTLRDRSIVLKGRVAHARISDVDQDVVTYSSGVQFIEASEGIESVIAQFIDLLRQERHSA